MKELEIEIILQNTGIYFDTQYFDKYPDVIFIRVFILSVQCPIGYIKVGNDCYGYKGGAIDLDSAKDSCKVCIVEDNGSMNGKVIIIQNLEK